MIAGMIDGMPFMPEMVQYCGRQYRVSKVAHKTCDTMHYSGIRRLPKAVYLEDLRCDGSDHGGCQAGCLLVWKDKWLKPAGSNQSSRRAEQFAAVERSPRSRINLTELTATKDPQTSEPIYTCQVTELLRATSAWAWWNPTQYLADVRTGNFPLWHVVRTLVLAALRWCADKFPNHPVFRRVHAWTLQRCDRPAHIMRGELHGRIAEGERTPESPDSLRVGDWVRIKPATEILSTLNRKGKNRGARFRPRDGPLLRRQAPGAQRCPQDH